MQNQLIWINELEHIINIRVSLNCSDFLVLRFIQAVQKYSEKLDFPEENETRTIINFPNLVVSLATVNLEKTSRLNFSANENVAKVSATNNPSKKPVDTFVVDFSLPKQAFQKANSTKVVFISYRKTSFFKLTKDTKVLIKGYVVAASLVNIKKIENLDEPAILRLPKSKNIDLSKHLCVFWNFKSNPKLGGWSDDGCKLQRNDQDEYDECHCNHLTSFAMLLVSLKLHVHAYSQIISITRVKTHNLLQVVTRREQCCAAPCGHCCQQCCSGLFEQHCSGMMNQPA